MIIDMTSKTKKPGKPRKKSGGQKPSRKGTGKSMGLFAKFFITLLIIAMIAIAILMVAKSLSNSGGKVSSKDIMETSVTVSQGKEEKKEPEYAEKKPVEKPSEKPSKQKTIIERTIEGNWMSVMEGATLTMKDSKYRIDFSGIDAGKPIIGTYKVEGDTITFDNEGVYKIGITNKNIKFVCQKDKAVKRKAALEFEWEWFE